MEQANAGNKLEQESSFYRTELRVLRSTSTDDDHFLNQVAVLLQAKDNEIRDLESELSSKVYLLNKLDIDHE